MKNPEEHRKHMEAKKKVNDISDIHEFEALLERVKLSEIDKQILRYIYIDQLTMVNVGEKLGFSEQCIKKKHKKALKRISAII